MLISALSRANLALALIGLNRFDEAQTVIDQGIARRLDSSGLHNRLYLIGFLRATAKRCSVRLSGSQAGRMNIKSVKFRHGHSPLQAGDERLPKP